MQDQVKRNRRGTEDGIRPALWFAAWCVHLYTAMGLVIAAWIVVLLVEGGPAAYRQVFLLMLLATFVDATDGTLARKIRVKKVLPNFDGRKLDDITDFLTYPFLPLMLVWRANLLPAGTNGWLILPLLASAYGFAGSRPRPPTVISWDSRRSGTSWPFTCTYSNSLATSRLGTIIVLSLMTFVPSRYLYPSQPGAFNMLNNVLGAIWAGFLTWLLVQLPAAQLPPRDGPAWQFALATLSYPAFYMLASWIITLNHWRKGDPKPTLEPVGAGSGHVPSH